jgi:hypothetical protein
MGKTTLTKLVVQKLIAYDTGLIPLPLILHGPTLLRPDAEAEAPERPGRLSTEARRRAEELGKVRLKQWVLRGLIAALYRHVCTHIIEAWENALSETVSPRSNPRRARRLPKDVQQLKAHLALKLEEAPNVATLRKIWRRAGFLRFGVLPHLYPCREWQRRRLGLSWPDDQGVREITAVAACALSYLTIIGATEETVSNLTASMATTRTTEKESPAAEAKQSKPVQEEAKSDIVKEQVKRIAPPALATVATAAIGIQHPDNWYLAFGAGLFVYSLGVISSRFKMRRDQFAELRRQLVVRVDWTERRLERELPALLRLVKDAGFAPIFVLDELDKLENEEKTLHDFLDFTKHIVRDHAAFVFLSHRDYFERLLPRPQDIPGGA